MKKAFLLFFLSAVSFAALLSCQQKADVMDYSDPSNWLNFESNPTKEVDVFYILPTVILEGTDSVVFFEENDKSRASLTYSVQARALEPLCNVYAPFYRQVPLNIACTIKSNEDYARLVRTHKGKQDIFAALDYYFKNVNNGRPFFIASHSQGTAMNRAVLEEYMKNHPEYFSRMVADYAIGYALPNGWLAANPHIKTAKGETDTGVVIGWNTEAPGASSHSILLSGDDYQINPLSWSTDTTYVPAEKSLGMLVSKAGEPEVTEAGRVDAKIDAERGSLLCSTLPDYIIQLEIFGDKSLHGNDWSAYYMDIRVNARKRAEAFVGHELQ